MSFRKTIFWLHLIAGVVAGISIFIMCLTGVALAFEKDLVAWAERDARRVAAPATDSGRLTLAELTARVQAVEPGAKPVALTIAADPSAAITFTLGRDNAVYANPYTGEVRRPASTRMHDFMHVMTDWHRWLALGGDQRAIGKAINGACNLAFFVLAVSGLYLWWPRSWSWRGFRAIALFNWRLTGKARDFNWHNAIGLWSAPILIILTLTALPISYRWAGDLIYTLAGEEAPVRRGPPGSAAPVETIPAPSPDAQPAGPDALIHAAQTALPDWSEITLRFGPQRVVAAEAPTGPQPVSVSIKTPGVWPRTAATTLRLNPFTAEVMRTENFADLSPARRFRTWTRFLHTGEALGPGGQFFAGLASLGGCFLVWTGFALTLRRFKGWRATRPV